MKPEVIVEAFKSLQDWSKWLVALETGICAGLWSKLTGGGAISPALYLGWILFAASIISAAVLLIAIPRAMHKFGQDGKLELKVVTRLVAIEYGLFLIGILCFVWRVTEAALAPAG